MTHNFACMFHYIGINQNYAGNSNWIANYDLLMESTDIRYLNAFYWSAVTTMTVGYGDLG